MVRGPEMPSSHRRYYSMDVIPAQRGIQEPIVRILACVGDMGHGSGKCDPATAFSTIPYIV
jgi:hypothetical protein